MLLAFVIALRSVSPTFGKTLPSPDVVSIFGQMLHQVADVRTELNTSCIERIRYVGRHNGSRLSYQLGPIAMVVVR